MRLVILDDYDLASEWAAKYICNRIIHFKPTADRYFTLGLPTGELKVFKHLPMYTVQSCPMYVFLNLLFLSEIYQDLEILYIRKIMVIIWTDCLQVAHPSAAIESWSNTTRMETCPSNTWRPLTWMSMWVSVNCTLSTQDLHKLSQNTAASQHKTTNAWIMHKTMHNTKHKTMLKSIFTLALHPIPFIA